MDSVRKIVEVHVSRDKGAKPPCPDCRKEYMVCDRLRKMVWRDLDCIPCNMTKITLFMNMFIKLRRNTPSLTFLQRHISLQKAI